MLYNFDNLAHAGDMSFLEKISTRIQIRFEFSCIFWWMIWKICIQTCEVYVKWIDFLLMCPKKASMCVKTIVKVRTSFPNICALLAPAKKNFTQLLCGNNCSVTWGLIYLLSISKFNRSFFYLLVSRLSCQKSEKKRTYQVVDINRINDLKKCDAFKTLLRKRRKNGSHSETLLNKKSKLKRLKDINIK